MRDSMYLDDLSPVKAQVGYGELGLYGSLAPPPPVTLLDCLGRVEMILPAPRPRAKRCMATVVSPGFEALLDGIWEA